MGIMVAPVWEDENVLETDGSDCGAVRKNLVQEHCTPQRG